MQSILNPSTMKNDLEDSSALLRPGELQQIAQFHQFRVHRAKATRWAVWDCKFLVYDDTDVQQYGCDSDDEEAALAAALKLSEENPEEVEDAAASSESKGKQKCDANAHDDGLCPVCSRIPEFPHHHTVRKFRLYRPRDDPTFEPHLCNHYLSISYCWPAPEDANTTGSTAGSYRVRDTDGSTRPSRAPDHVLDRAVEAATTLGLRMIWIDQECLPQPGAGAPDHEKEEQELGIQAMDIVYQRAEATAGLLNMELSSDVQARALRILSDWSMDEILMRGDLGALMQLIVEFLTALKADRWYTRAWVVQESISAGRSLILTMRKARGVLFPSQLRMAGVGAHQGVVHSTDGNGPFDRESSIACLPIENFKRIIQKMKMLCSSYVGKNAVDASGGYMLEHAASLDFLQAAEELHPNLLEPRTVSSFVSIRGGGVFGQTYKIEGAGALALLKRRRCRTISDMIAIMANLCHYEMRLDTKMAAKHCTSLRVALLALALLNGDFSVLAPEAYKESGSPESRHFPQAPDEHKIQRLLEPYSKHAEVIAPVEVRTWNIYRYVGGDVYDPSEFLFPAFIWNVREVVDLTPIKLAWLERWLSALCFTITFPAPGEQKSSGDAPHDTEAFRTAIAAHFQREEVADMARWEIVQNRRLAEDSPVWGNLPHEGVEVKLLLLADRVEASRPIRDFISDLIFETLRYLYYESPQGSLAKSLANSIWHSVRTDAVSRESSNNFLPDQVDDALFCHADVLDNKWNTLQLDRTIEGSYHQMWLFEHIMSTGKVWAGRYQRDTAWDSFENQPGSAEPSTVNRAASPASSDIYGAGAGEKDAAMEQAEESKGLDSQAASSPSYSSIATAVDDAPSASPVSQIPQENSAAGSSRQPEITQHQEPPDPPNQETSNDEGDPVYESIIMRQGSMVMLSYMAAIAAVRNLKEDAGTSVPTGSITYFALLAKLSIWSSATEREREANLVAAFDVDGPCDVAVPYSSEWEFLPRPSYRSMRVCWVVEKRSEPQSTASAAVATRKDAAEEKSGASPDEPDGRTIVPQMPPRCAGDYLVVNKVKGMWEIFLPPHQRYTFS